jgi:uncharacterized damage-inducible protein DinB
MSAPATADLRYPIGKFQRPVAFTAADRQKWIADIEALPAKMREAARGLNNQQLDTPYREGGWTVRQLLHHVPDSHLNAYCRFKLALTEDVPTIKPYDEKLWAELPDTYATPIEVSLDLLEAVHVRWVNLLKALTPAQLARKFKHPEMGELSLDQLLALYAWHSRHHLAHITELRQRMRW